MIVTTGPAFMPIEQVKHICDEYDTLRKENEELAAMLKLSAAVITNMGTKVMFLADEVEHLERLLKIAERYQTQD